MATFQRNTSKDRLLAPSIRSSRPASVMTTDSIDTIIASRPLPASSQPAAQSSRHENSTTSSPPATTTTQGPQPYRGFPSHEAYLAALRSWVEEKMYFESDYQLRGFYGTKPMQYYMDKPGLRSHKKSKNQEGKQVDRRASLARVPTRESVTSGKSQDDEQKTESTFKSKAKAVFGRRATVV